MGGLGWQARCHNPPLLGSFKPNRWTVTHIYGALACSPSYIIACLCFSTLNKNLQALLVASIVQFLITTMKTSRWVQINSPPRSCHHKHNEENSRSEDAFQLRSSIWFMIFEKRNVPGAMVNSAIFFPHHHTVSTETIKQNARTHTRLACSCMWSRTSPINQAALESIGNIKRLNLFRCLVLIAYYTIITHLRSHGAWEGQTQPPQPHT